MNLQSASSKVAGQFSSFPREPRRRVGREARPASPSIIVEARQAMRSIVREAPPVPRTIARRAQEAPGAPARDAPQAPRLEDERQLARRWRQHRDRKALALMVQAHQGLVVRIAGEFRYAGPAFEDLLQEGQVGLTIAARRFDPARRTRLSTYATFWIRACMMDHVVRSHGAVRVGTTRAQRKIFFGLGKARRHLEMQGLEADVAGLAAELEVKADDIHAMLGRLTRSDLYLNGDGDSLIGNEDSALLMERLAELGGEDPEQQFASSEEQHIRTGRLMRALQQLDKREQEILHLRHLRDRPETLAEVGQRFGLSRERVRQLETRATARVRQLCLRRY